VRFIMRMFSKKFVSLFLVFLVFCSAVFCTPAAFAAENNLVETTDAVRLRSSAKIAPDNTITTLDVKETLTLLKDSADGWAYVSRKDGTKGYCSIDYLNVPSGSTVTFTGATNDDVYFRKGPDTTYDYIDLLSKNTEFSVVDNSNELWVKAKIDGKVGYVYREYVDIALTLPEKDEEPEPKPVYPDDPETPDWFNSSVLDDIVTEPEVKVEPLQVFLAEKTVVMEERESYTLTAYTSDPASSAVVSFKSSDTSVATVSSAGVVQGLAVGNVTITAYIEGTEETATCAITVNKSTKPQLEDKLILSNDNVSIYEGNHLILKANLTNVKWKTSNSSIVSVSDGILTAKTKGVAYITVYTNTQSLTVKAEVLAAKNGVSIYKSTAQISAGKSYYNGVTSSDTVTWSSSDTSVAKVQNGFITAVKPGKAVITAHNTKGTKTCLVTVTSAEPIRFAYSSPNTAAIGEKVQLSAVTDSKRTAVKFEVTVNGKVNTVNATKKEKDGSTLIWTGEISISSAGTYDVVAYSKTGSSDWQTCSSGISDAKTTVFIRKTKDKNIETKENRRATDEAIELIAGFEGYSSSVYFDTIANNIPTIGYGKVIYIGDSFYNDMTKKEAYAYLVRTVNDGGFTSAVNKCLSSYDVYFNQQHFDALISFSYNLGSNIISSDSDFKKIFTATSVEEGNSDKDAFINATDVNLRSGPGTNYEILGVLNTGDKVTLVNTSPQNNWYQLQTADGKKGYVYADYVTKGAQSTTSEHYLSKINKRDFTDLLLQYHHAGTTCVWGLLYRRVDELDVFFYGEYSRNGAKNVNKFSYKCSNNSSTKI